LAFTTTALVDSERHLNRAVEMHLCTGGQEPESGGEAGDSGRNCTCWWYCLAKQLVNLALPHPL